VCEKSGFGSFALFLFIGIILGTGGTTLLFRESKATDTRRIEQLRAENERLAKSQQQLAEEQRRSADFIEQSKSIITESIGSIAKIRKLVELYFPGE